MAQICFKHKHQILLALQLRRKSDRLGVGVREAFFRAVRWDRVQLGAIQDQELARHHLGGIIGLAGSQKIFVALVAAGQGIVGLGDMPWQARTTKPVRIKGGEHGDRSGKSRMQDSKKAG